MAVYRAQIGFPLDSGLPRDVVTINPHYSGDNAQGLADALKANLIANANVAALYPFTIKVYDAQKAPPSFPLGSASNGTSFTSASIPRELALCLSYYAGVNRPRYRGRLYIPGALAGATNPVLRPTAGQIAKALSFGPTLGKNLPSGHSWCVWSKTDKVARNVSNFWVDDEWDIVRSRGMKGTTRQLGTIP
jgi:hypothetical protein